MLASFDGITYKTNDEVFRWHIENGLCEPYPKLIDVVARYQSMFPHKNGTFVDVGGHIGTTSLPYSKKFKLVYAYEPNPESYILLLENIALNRAFSKIIPNNKGAFNKTMRCEVVRHEGNNSGCYFIREVSSGGIPVVKLDDEYIEGPVDFLKIDTEGSELFVLEGAIEMIKKWKPLIQVETNHLSDKLFGYNKEKINSFLSSLGYIVFDNTTDPNNMFFMCP